MQNAIVTKHKLDFQVSEWNDGIMLFKIGTCHGQWMAIKHAYCILSIINENQGNGHLDDVFEWFENSCRRDKKELMILEFMNDRFKTHCIKKRGFMAVPNTDHAIKFFTK